MVAVVGKMDVLAEDGLVPVVPAAAVRAAAAKRAEAYFGSSGQVLQLRTHFRLGNGQHLASGRCREGMLVVQSSCSPISSSDDQGETLKGQLEDLVAARRLVVVVETEEVAVGMVREERKALEHSAVGKDAAEGVEGLEGPSCRSRHVVALPWLMMSRGRFCFSSPASSQGVVEKSFWLAGAHAVDQFW